MTNLLDPTNQRKYHNALPVPSFDNGLQIDARRGGDLFIGIEEDEHWAGLTVPGTENRLHTTVWGYGQTDRNGHFSTGPTWPGPTIWAMEGNPLNVTFFNKLDNYSRKGGHLLPFDDTYHTILEAVIDKSKTPTNVHLHGGHTDADSDGFAEEVYNQGERWTNNYDNSQQSGTLWYHPHTLGRTRLDVYAGLAGFYLLRDKNEEKLIEEGHLPGEDYEIEMAFQDRMFTEDGELYLPSSSDEFYAPGELEILRSDLQEFLVSEGILEPGENLPPVPEITGLPEFFGDHILANGVIWPDLEVEKTQYRFRLLNGSDSRAYIFEIQDDQSGAPGKDRFSFYQIGTDLGLMEKPVELERLVLMPGERADVVVDFHKLMAEDAARDRNADTEFFLRNFGPDDPFGGFADNTAAIATPDGFQNAGLVDPANPATTGQVIRFDVNPDDEIQTKFDPERVLNPSLSEVFNTDLNEAKASYTRRLGLFEGQDEFGRLQPMLGSVEPVLNEDGEIVNGSLVWSDPTTEVIQLDENGEATEIWEIWNLTGDAHPVHLHLTAFKVLDRTPFDLNIELPKKPQVLHNGEYGSGFTFDDPLAGPGLGSIDDYVTTGSTYGAQANEIGLKDTAIALPGQMTRIAAYFDKPGRYVWHCHILSHEDHDMMRIFDVVPHDQNAGGGVLDIGLYDADSDTLITVINEGDEIMESTLEDRNVTIAAFVPEDSSFFNQVHSMRLNLNDGEVSRTENTEPYSLFGDVNGDYRGGTLPFGDNRIAFEVYSDNNLRGDFLGTVTRNFSIVEDLGEGEDLDIGLYDADSDELITPLNEGDELLASALEGRNVTIAAFVPEDSPFFGQVHSMRLNLNDGEVSRTENTEPYSLFGDFSGNYSGGTLPFGDNRIAFELYPDNNLRGGLLDTVTLNFTITNDQ